MGWGSFCFCHACYVFVQCDLLRKSIRGDGGARVQLSCPLCVQFDMLVIRVGGYVTLSGLLRCQCSVLAIRRGEGTVCQWQP